MYLIIGKKDCPSCIAAKGLLSKQYQEDGIPFVNKCLDRMSQVERDVWTCFIKDDLQATTVPQIVKLVGGFDELKQLLGDNYEGITIETGQEAA